MDITIARIVLVMMACVGIYDLYRIKRGMQTLSQIVQRWQPKHVDTIIFFVLMILGWWIWGEVGFIQILYGGLAFHFFVQQPRN